VVALASLLMLLMTTFQTDSNGSRSPPLRVNAREVMHGTKCAFVRIGF